MKTIFTLIVLTFFGTLAQAQDISKETKVEAITMGVDSVVYVQQARKDRSMARLYKFKNSKVKKALSFSTKNNRSKLA